MILTAVIVLTIMSIKELLTVLRKSRWKEVAIYSVLTAINLIWAILGFLDIDVPVPQDAINWMGKLG